MVLTTHEFTTTLARLLCAQSDVATYQIRGREVPDPLLPQDYYADMQTGAMCRRDELRALLSREYNGLYIDLKIARDNEQELAAQLLAAQAARDRAQRAYHREIASHLNTINAFDEVFTAAEDHATRMRRIRERLLEEM